MAKAIRVQQGVFGRLAILDLDHSLITHAHAQPHILIKLGGADASFTVGCSNVPLRQGQLVLVNASVPHAFHHPPGATYTLLLAIYLEPLWLDLVRLGHTERRSFGTPAMEWTLEIERIVRELAAGLIFEGPKQLLCERLLADLVRQIERSLRAPATQEQPRQRRAPALLDRRVAQCVDYMRAHLDARTPIGELAQHCGLSRPHMFELFQRSFDMAPGVYWNTLRMQYAIDRLHGKRATPVGDIASELGFASQGNFTRFFRSIQGVAPRQYLDAVA